MKANPGRWNDITQGGKIKTTVLTSFPPVRAEARAFLDHRPLLSRSGQSAGRQSTDTVRDHSRSI
jgi:hypothetical protein